MKKLKKIAEQTTDKNLDATTSVQTLKDAVEAFVTEREWQQFHSAKNLSMCIAIEAAELMEKFVWLSDQQIPQEFEKHRQEIEHELIDVIFASFALANRYTIDLTTAFMRKLELNKQKYPAEKAKGRADKYHAYIEQKNKNTKKS